MRGGIAEGNYMFGIYRNIPFAIMGGLLIYWSYQQRDKAAVCPANPKGLK